MSNEIEWNINILGFWEVAECHVISIISLLFVLGLRFKEFDTIVHSNMGGTSGISYSVELEASNM